MGEQLTESDVKKIEEEIQHRKHVIRKQGKCAHGYRSWRW